MFCGLYRWSPQIETTYGTWSLPPISKLGCRQWRQTSFSFLISCRQNCVANFITSFGTCHLADCSSGWLEGPNKVYIPFLACGDLSGYDSDRSYPLPKVAEGTYQSLDPVQPPIAPPYKRALEMKKASSQGIRELEKLSLDS